MHCVPFYETGVVSLICLINHFSISPILCDYGHITFNLAIWITMETGERENREIGVVNQISGNTWQGNKKRFFSSHLKMFQREKKE